MHCFWSVATAVFDNLPRAIEAFLTGWRLRGGHGRYRSLHVDVPYRIHTVYVPDCASGILLDAGCAVSGREKMQKLKEQTVVNNIPLGLFY